MGDGPSPGPLIGNGRSADVYEYGPSEVLRRYRQPRDTEREVAGMEHARRHGFPVAEAKALSETEIVMRRLHGPTMLDEMGRRPWLLGRQAKLLASLHRRLHAIEAPGWLPAPVREGTQLLHLDLHPDNVILTLLSAMGRRAFIGAFLRQFDAAERAEIKRWIPICATARLGDRALPESERTKVARLIGG